MSELLVVTIHRRHENFVVAARDIEQARREMQRHGGKAATVARWEHRTPPGVRLYQWRETWTCVEQFELP